MRPILTLPLLVAVAACSIDSDSGNDPVTLEYNEQRIRDAARTTARTAREFGATAGNVAAATGRAVLNEVGDVDLDVNVSRNRPGEQRNDTRPR